MSLRQSSVDYQRIAAALAYLQAHQASQPTLAELARHFGLGESHFQRLFSRWAGISPKRFLQYLTVEYAKSRIAAPTDLLQLSLDVGLSGSGRLHDLFVVMEGLSPGEYRRAASGMLIRYGITPTPFGDALIGFSERGICHLAFCQALARDPLPELVRRWPAARLEADDAGAQVLARRLFAQESPGRPLSAWVVGSNFQIQVWRALLRLPFGQLLSYGQLAAEVGRPGAARAVGSAMAANPIAYLIPCHRVLRRSGHCGEYHWGSERKAAMVAWEAARSEGVEMTDG